MGRLYTIGECLIDFIPRERGVPLREVTTFTRRAGGAPANVAAAVARLGGESSYIGKLGSDAFGDFLVETLSRCGVDTRHVLRTDEANTALAFVSLREDGDRDFSFYRKPSADMLLRRDEIDGSWFRPGDVLHFCSVDLVDAPVRGAHEAAIAEAIKRGAAVSFDVNVRLPLWESPAACRAAVLAFLDRADIVKVSEDEAAFLTGETDEAAAAKKLLAIAKRAKLLFVTRGAAGVTVYDRQGGCVSHPGYPVAAVDTTGAGDCFIGCVLYRLLEAGAIPALEELAPVLAFACRGASLIVTREGAIDSMPTRAEIEAFEK